MATLCLDVLPLPRIRGFDPPPARVFAWHCPGVGCIQVFANSCFIWRMHRCKQS
ncbi:hypothetical protein ZEAMMB73_Zm00001d007064 [Zea mays]|nr:hypothetical protein ZEAMMB73_Zm00001d007064 [Zea mays]